MLGFSKQETDTVRAILDSPEAKALAEKRAAAVAAERVTVAGELKELEGRAGATWLAREREIAEATTEYESARQALLAAERKLITAQTQRSNDSAAFSRKIEGCEAKLRETAHPAIAEFIAQMWSEWNAAMKAPMFDTSSVVRNINTGKRQAQPGKPVILPKHRMEAIREVIAKAEGLKLQADQSNVEAQLAELRASVPAVGADIPEKSNLDAIRALFPGKRAA